MTYYPSVGEEVLIERPSDSDCFEARIKSVSGKSGDPPWEVEIEFERLDGAVALNPTCRLSDVVGSRDPAKADACRELQSLLVSIEQQLEADEQKRLLDNY